MKQSNQIIVHCQEEMHTQWNHWQLVGTWVLAVVSEGKTLNVLRFQN